MYIKLQWLEPATSSVEHGIVPLVWVVNVDGYELLRWPNRTNVQPLIDSRTMPSNEWQTFYVLNKLSTPGNNHCVGMKNNKTKTIIIFLYAINF